MFRLGEKIKTESSHVNCYGRIRKGTWVTIIDIDGSGMYTIQNRKGLIIKGVISI